MYPFYIALSLMSLLMGGDKAEIIFAGDAMQHQGQIDAARNADGTYSYEGCFDAVSQYIRNADFAVVNLETPLAGKPYTGYPCFSAPDSYADALTNAGFDLLLTANNHCLDKRDRGLCRTIDVLEQKKVLHIGTYRNQAQRDSILPMVRNINGFKVAFLNYTYGTNGIPIQGDVVVDMIDRDKMASDISRARQAGAELVAVTVHWGNEYQLLPHRSQRELADFLIDQGVDMIIGSHPHVIQPMEIRHSDKYNKDVLLVYSLGNFISNMKTRDARGGAMVKVSLKRSDSGKAYVDGASYRLVFPIPPGDGYKNYRLVPVEDCPEGLWYNRCKAFETSAEAIFKKHNINVARDTVSINTSPTEKLTSVVSMPKFP